MLDDAAFRTTALNKTTVVFFFFFFSLIDNLRLNIIAFSFHVALDLWVPLTTAQSLARGGVMFTHAESSALDSNHATKRS